MKNKKLFTKVYYFYSLTAETMGLSFSDEGVYCTDLPPPKAFSKLKEQFTRTKGDIVKFHSFNRI